MFEAARQLGWTPSAALVVERGTTSRCFPMPQKKIADNRAAERAQWETGREKLLPSGSR